MGVQEHNCPHSLPSWNCRERKVASSTRFYNEIVNPSIEFSPSNNFDLVRNFFCFFYFFYIFLCRIQILPVLLFSERHSWHFAGYRSVGSFLRAAFLANRHEKILNCAVTSISYGIPGKVRYPCWYQSSRQRSTWCSISVRNPGVFFFFSFFKFFGNGKAKDPITNHITARRIHRQSKINTR